MQIKHARFLISNTDHQKCPPADKPEYAFIGRSNVGKSSLINMLTDNKYLAKTSSQPGKTQLINHFVINEQWYLVDLPGYGYARSSQTNRAKWSKMIANYLENRENLMSVLLLIDSRIPPQKIDLDFIQFLGEKGIPFIIVFTKVDKNSQRQTDLNVNAYQKTLKETWEELPKILLSSAETRYGKETILDYIEQTNKLYGKSL